MFTHAEHTFYVDVNSIDEDGYVGTTLDAAKDELAAQIMPPVLGDFVRVIDSDGATCSAVVTDTADGGWLRVRLVGSWYEPNGGIPVHGTSYPHYSSSCYSPFRSGTLAGAN